MSITKVSDYAVGDIDLTAMMNTLNKAYKSQAAVTLSNYDNDSAPVVKVGSVFDNNGTQYAVTGTDETPTGYSGISNSTTFYLYFDESAEAFIYDSTAPSWSDDLQGWYNGNDRALFSMYKDSGGTLYQGKSKLIHYTYQQLTMKSVSVSVPSSGSTVIPIGMFVWTDNGFNKIQVRKVGSTNIIEEKGGYIVSDGRTFEFYNPDSSIGSIVQLYKIGKI